MRGATIHRLIGKSPFARAFVNQTRPQGHHRSGFLGYAVSVNGRMKKFSFSPD